MPNLPNISMITSSKNHSKPTLLDTQQVLVEKLLCYVIIVCWFKTIRLASEKKNPKPPKNYQKPWEKHGITTKTSGIIHPSVCSSLRLCRRCLLRLATTFLLLGLSSGGEAAKRTTRNDGSESQEEVFT